MRRGKYLEHYGKCVVEALGPVGSEAWQAIPPGTKVLDMVSGEYDRKGLVKAPGMFRMR